MFNSITSMLAIHSTQLLNRKPYSIFLVKNVRLGCYEIVTSKDFCYTDNGAICIPNFESVSHLKVYENDFVLDLGNPQSARDIGELIPYNDNMSISKGTTILMTSSLPNKPYKSMVTLEDKPSNVSLNSIKKIGIGFDYKYLTGVFVMHPNFNLENHVVEDILKTFN